jgi:uncharacterized protein (TIGR02271 family)
MAIVAYSQQDEFDLVNSGQDCMGWTVVDQAGNSIGKVTEMLIQTDQMHVDSIMVSGGVRIPAQDIALRDGRVVVRGVLHQEQYAETRRTVATTTAAAGGTQTYQAVQREQNAQHVAGVTRQANEDEITIPIIEEQLVVGKRTVEKGGVNVRTTMTEKPVQESVTLREEQVHVERHAVNRPVDASTAEAFKEGTFEVTTKAEVPVVAKEARVVEEVVVGKEMTEHTETVRDTVKRTDVEVDEINTGNAENRRNN